MNSLGKVASLATIVAAIFTVLTYFDNENSVEIVSSSETLVTTQLSSIRDEHTDLGKSEDLGISVAENYNCESPLYSQEQIRKRFNIAQKIPVTMSKNDALAALATKAVDMCYYDIAFEIGEVIPVTMTKNKILSYISLKIAKAGDIEKAAEVAYKIPVIATKNSTLKIISSL